MGETLRWLNVRLIDGLGKLYHKAWILFYGPLLILCNPSLLFLGICDLEKIALTEKWRNLLLAVILNSTICQGASDEGCGGNSTGLFLINLILNCWLSPPLPPFEPYKMIWKYGFPSKQSLCVWLLWGKLTLVSIYTIP